MSQSIKLLTERRNELSECIRYAQTVIKNQDAQTENIERERSIRVDQLDSYTEELEDIEAALVKLAKPTKKPPGRPRKAR